MSEIASGDISENAFQEEEPFYGGDDANEAGKGQIYLKLRSFPIIGWSLLIGEWSERLGHPFLSVIANIFIYIFIIIVFLPLFLYACLIGFLRSILYLCGIQVHSDSPTRKGRFIYLLTLTLPSIPVPPFVLSALLYAPWNSFVSNISFRSHFYFTAPIVLLLAIEWISFFLTEIWRCSIEGDLQRFLPAAGRK